MEVPTDQKHQDDQTMAMSPAMSTVLPPPRPLDVKGDPWIEWKKWQSEFHLFSVATRLNMQPAEVQAATFLVTIGEEGRRIYRTFRFEDESDRNKLEVLITKFEQHCKPATNLTYHEFVFGSRDQTENEPFDDWLTELRILVQNCEFKEMEDRMLRSRIILGLRDKDLQKVLINENPELGKLIEKCRLREQSLMQYETIQGRAKGIAVNALNRDKTQIHCGRCGFARHEKDECPAKGKICKKCGKRNHFARVCKSRPGRKSRRDASQSIKGRQYKKEVDSLEHEYFLHSLSVNQVGGEKLWETEISIEDVKTTCRIDTGANCSVISKTVLEKITQKKFWKSNVFLKSFFGHKEQAIGEISLKLTKDDKTATAKFFVVTRDVPTTVSGRVSEDLGIIKLLAVVTQDENATHLYEVAEPFRDVFCGLGKLGNFTYHMKLKSPARGVVRPARKVPLALQEKVKAELDKMKSDGVIREVTDPTEWCSPMVTVVKKDKVRICMDPTDLNKALLREEYPMPTIEEVLSKIHSAKFFTTLDAACGFWQISLDEASSHLCTMSTPFGRFRFLRMPFGISSAPEVFQRSMHQVFSGLQGVEVVMDDILIWGKTKDDHDYNLKQVLQRCQEANLKLNLRKCRFLRTEVKYLGFLLTEHGVKIDPSRRDDILAIEAPKNVEELRKFLGMMTFVSRFLPNFSEMSSPLRDLLKKDNAWVWSVEQQTSFEKLREALVKVPVLAFYKPGKPIVLSVDASQRGVGAVILQENQPLGYSSRSLTECQQKYAQIEKEMLAIVHGCKRYHYYIFGQPKVFVETDHKPLEQIFKKPLHECPLRLQRMRLSLQRYPLQVQYKRGKDLHVADALSRFPSQKQLQEEEQEYDVNVTECVTASNKRLQEILQATDVDSDLSTLRRYASAGWPEKKSDVPEPLLPYWAIQDEIHVQDGIVYRSNRLIIPKAKRKEVLTLLHAAHGGIAKMKERARTVMYWPTMSAEIEQLTRNCLLCRKYQNAQARLPLHSHDLPNLPWQIVGIDLLTHNGDNYAVLVDAYSFFFELKKLSRTTSEALISFCASAFATHGIPERVRSDNGPPFNSAQFKTFLDNIGATHVTSSPHYPRSNGLVERAVQEAKKILNKTRYNSVDYYTALLEWRNMPRDSILKSPVERLMGRQTRTLLPTHPARLEPQVVSPARVKARLSEMRKRQRVYYNRGTTDLPELTSGTSALFFDKLRHVWSPAVVVGAAPYPRSYVLRTKDGTDLRRTREHIKPVQQDHQHEQGSSTPEPLDLASPHTTGPPVEAEQLPRRGTRPRKEPRRYPDPEN